MVDLVWFFEPLSDEGWADSRLDREMFVVGINKGLLARAFLAPRAPFSKLTEAVEALATSGSVQRPVRLAVVDLNLRAEVALPLEAVDSLYDRILTRLIAPNLWEELGCSDCDDADWCPFLANVSRLRRDLPRERMKLLWVVQQLRSDRHGTLRDLLAGLAYVLVGHEDMFRLGDDAEAGIQHPCGFVEREKGAVEPLALFRRLAYNTAFVDDDIYERHAESLEPGATRSVDISYGLGPPVVTEQLNSLDPATGVSNEYWEAFRAAVPC